MAIEHVSIAEVNLHEPKGVSVATAGKVYISDGAGSGDWTVPQLEGQVDAVADTIPVSNGTGSVTWESKDVTANRLLNGKSVAASQGPSAVDTAHQIEFGPEVVTAEVTLSALGALTFHVAGSYEIAFNGQFSRSTGAGASIMFFRLLKNGTQISPSREFKLDSSNTSVPMSQDSVATLAVNDVITVEFYRDSAGVNDGALSSETPTLAGWSASTNADITVNKLGVGAI